MIFELLRERVGQARKAAHLHRMVSWWRSPFSVRRAAGSAEMLMRILVYRELENRDASEGSPSTIRQ
ncbi:hypothetical protein [Mesorhizobium loti]|uniref:hypothetical protein n=1 Tax=Rhizobium loti TaxID=381 RepID=UPI001929FD08|nr:hypothetical protein [Mesorhizobium loti]